MTSLRQQMTDEMQRRGLSLRTQQSYLNAVRQLAEYYQKPPDQIDGEELCVFPLSDEREAAPFQHAEDSKAVVCLHCGQPMTVIQRIQPVAKLQ